MKFEPPQCPECGEVADGTVDVVPGRALFTAPDERGHVEWAGETKMFWDGQQTEIDAQGRWGLECTNGHQWYAVLEEDERPETRPETCPLQHHEAMWVDD